MKDGKALMDIIGLERDFWGDNLLLVVHGASWYKWYFSIPMDYISAQSNIQGKTLPSLYRRVHAWPLNLFFSFQFAVMYHATSTKKVRKKKASSYGGCIRMGYCGRCGAAK